MLERLTAPIALVLILLASLAAAPGRRARRPPAGRADAAGEAGAPLGDDQLGAPGDRDRHTGANHDVARLDVPPLYLTDGPVGPRQGAGATAMPAPLSLAAAFDPVLAARAGALVADEAKAKGNDLVYAPTVNIMRTPRGGRTFESYGEDPYLTARTAVGWINGAQATGIIADVKHYAANNQETGRMSINAEIDERTLREIYLPHFEAAVKDAGSGSVMCAYNKVNTQYSCENGHLLKDISSGSGASRASSSPTIPPRTTRLPP